MSDGVDDVTMPDMARVLAEAKARRARGERSRLAELSGSREDRARALVQQQPAQQAARQAVLDLVGRSVSPTIPREQVAQQQAQQQRPNIAAMQAQLMEQGLSAREAMQKLVEGGHIDPRMAAMIGRVPDEATRQGY